MCAWSLPASASDHSNLSTETGSVRGRHDVRYWVTLNGTWVKKRKDVFFYAVGKDDG